MIIVGIIIGIIGISVLGTKQQNHSQEINNSPEIGDMKKAHRILSEDNRIQKIIGGKPFSRELGIIPNETYAEYYLRIGGEWHEEVTPDNGIKRYMTGGKIYKISIDLRSETVISVREETNQTILNFIEETHRDVTAGPEIIYPLSPGV
ncbi:MAG TPA: hypothetical protein C5S37_02345 [Methanophagales archaeon]|nr:hypothetical protein [Methanophagales archaeon]